MKKLKIGWFSFSCCEDSTIVFTEMLNDHYEEWFKLLDFKHVRVLKSKNDMKNLDVAFVEGAITSIRGEKELKEIRKNCKKLVAIGACAIMGMPSSQRNTFDKKRQEEIKFLIDRFKLKKKVNTLKELVKVDYEVPGCPMEEDDFLEILNKLLKEFKIA